MKPSSFMLLSNDVENRISSLLTKSFYGNGELNVMLTSFLSSCQLSEEDIEELKQILERSKK